MARVGFEEGAAPGPLERQAACLPQAVPKILPKSS